MRVPNEADWRFEEPVGLDDEYAKKNFFGKTPEEAERLFARNALHFQEDLSYMPTIPFRFYLPAFLRYLEGEESVGEPDGASAFIDLVAWKLESAPADLAPLKTSVVATLEYVAKNQKKFNADVSIYGNFHNRIEKVLRTLRSLASE